MVLLGVQYATYVSFGRVHKDLAILAILILHRIHDPSCSPGPILALAGDMYTSNNRSVEY
jgi:hypothetical protein